MIVSVRTAPSSGTPSRGAAVLLFAITLLGTALRLYRLGAQPLWIDEDASFEDAQAFARDGLAGLATDHVAPLHTVLLWAVSRIGGAGEWMLRLPSVIAGVLCIPVTFVLVRRLFGDTRVGVLAALLIAVSPFAIWYAQEARMYALLMLLGLLHVHLSWPAVRRDLRAAELAALALVTTAGLYTHHYMLLLSGTSGLFMLLAQGLPGVAATLGSRRFCWWSATQVVAVVLFGFWLWLTADKLGNDAGFSKPAAILWAPYALFSFVTGPTFGPSTAELRADVAAALRGEAIAIAVASGAAAIVSLMALRAALRVDRRLAGAWLLTWLFTPIALAILATLLTRIQFNVRYVIFSLPALMILFALAFADALAAPRRHWLVLAAGVVMLAVMTVSLANWFAGTRYAKEDLRGVAAIMRPARDGTMIVADNQRAIPILNYYAMRLPADTLAVDNVTSGRTPAIVVATLERAVHQQPMWRVWFVSYRTWEGDPEHRVRDWLDTRCRIVREDRFSGALLRGYASCMPRSGDTNVSPSPPIAPGR